MAKLTFSDVKKELADAKEDLTNKDKTLKTRTLAIVALLSVVLVLTGILIF